MAASRSLPPGSKGCRNLRLCVRDGETVLSGVLYYPADTHLIGVYDAVENAIRYNGELYSLNEFAYKWCLNRWVNGGGHPAELTASLDGWRYCKVRDVDGRWIVMSRLKPLSEVAFNSDEPDYVRDVAAEAAVAAADAAADAKERKMAAYEATTAAAHEKRDPRLRISRCKTNVNELVNAELYAKVSALTGESIAYLKRNYTPQEMRGSLLLCYKDYYEGPIVEGPRKKNRGITK